MTGPDVGVRIRSAMAEDVEQMLVIEAELFGVDAWSHQQVSDELDRVGESRWYAVAESGGRVVGYAGLYLSPPDADVQTVAVAAGQQRRGVGRRLLSTAIEAAWHAGCARLFLEVRADNAAALGLYQAVGFVRLGRRRRYYADGVDAVTMRLRRHEPPPLGGADA